MWSDAPDCTVRMMGSVSYVCIALEALVLRALPSSGHRASRGSSAYGPRWRIAHEPNLFGQRLGPPLDHVGTVAATRAGMSAEAYIGVILDPGAYLVRGTRTRCRGARRDLSPTAWTPWSPTF